MNVSQEVRQKLLAYQRSEITEHHIYARLAGTIRSPENRQVLEHIAEDELRHYQQWRGYTQQEVGPDRWSIWKYYLISRVLGFTFGAKLMEKAEGDIQGSYEQLQDVIPEAEPSCMRNKSTRRPCCKCWMKRGSATPAPSCWGSTTRWWS